MCGRYSLALSNEEVYDALENQLPRMFNHGGRRRWERPQDYRPKRVTLTFPVRNILMRLFSYNMAPHQRAPVIRRDHESGEPMIETM
jgi:putative SOS response-associated peptidase YedK